MADTFTSLLRLVLQETGGNQNIWGDINNASAIDLLEDAIAARLDLDVTPAIDPVTLFSLNGDVDQSRNAIIALTGNPGSTRAIIVPSTSKLYIVSNETSPGFDMTIKTAANPGVVVSPGTRIAVVVDPVADDVFGIGDIPTATEDTAGVLEIADQAEMDAGLLDDKIVTPAKYEGRATSDSLSGHIELADQSEVDLGVETNLAVTPETLDGRQATELLTGLSAIADQTEVDAGLNDTKFITPLKLEQKPASSSGSGRRGAMAFSSVNVVFARNDAPLFTAADVPQEGVIPLNSEVYDTDSVHDNSVNNSRLTVPAGVTVIRLNAGFTMFPALTGLHHLRIRKDAGFGSIDPAMASYIPHYTIAGAGTGSNKGMHSMSTGAIDVAEDDFFEIYGLAQTNNTTAIAGTIWFEMEILE